MKNSIEELWGVHSIQHYDKYLELPSFVGKSKYHTFQDIKDKVWAKKVKQMDSKNFEAEHKVLIKVVV